MVKTNWTVKNEEHWLSAGNKYSHYLQALWCFRGKMGSKTCYVKEQNKGRTIKLFWYILCSGLQKYGNNEIQNFKSFSGPESCFLFSQHVSVFTCVSSTSPKLPTVVCSGWRWIPALFLCDLRNVCKHPEKYSEKKSKNCRVLLFRTYQYRCGRQCACGSLRCTRSDKSRVC